MAAMVPEGEDPSGIVVGRGAWNLRDLHGGDLVSSTFSFWILRA